MYRNGYPTATVQRYPCVQTYTVGTVKRQRYAMCMPQIQAVNSQVCAENYFAEGYRTVIFWYSGFKPDINPILNASRLAGTSIFLANRCE